MRTRETSVVLLLGIVSLEVTGCSSTSAFRSSVSPKMRTVASIGDKALPVSSGEPGAAVTAEVDEPVRPLKPEGMISGRVVDAHGDPVANARVRLAVSGVPKGRVIRATTDRSGAFTLKGLRPGSSYTLIAEWEDEKGVMTGRGEAQAPETGVRISLAAQDDGGSRTSRGQRVSPVSARDDEADADDPEENAGWNKEDLAPPAQDARTIVKPRTRRSARAEPSAAVEEAPMTARWRRSDLPKSRPAAPQPAAEEPAENDSQPAPTPATDPTTLDDDGPNPLPPAKEPGEVSARRSTTDRSEPITHAATAPRRRSESRAPSRPQPTKPAAGDDLPPPSESVFASETPAPKRPTWEDLSALKAEPPLHGGRPTTPSDQPPTRVATENPPREERPASASDRTGGDAVAYCRFDSRHRQLIDFRLPDLEGKPVRFQELDADLILLDFWGSWCEPCLQSIPHLAEIQDRLGDRRLRVIGIACEQGPRDQRVANVSRAIKSLGVNYPILMSGMDADTCPVQESLHIQAFPTMILLDRQGRILWRDQGATPTTLARLDRFLADATKGDTARR